MHWRLKQAGTTVPVWLQIALDIFAILDPEFSWLVPVIEVAYVIWKDLPFFHKTGALIDLRKAVADAKMAKNTGSDNPTHYVSDWSDLWKTKTKSA